VRCPGCGFTGEEGLFRDGCPVCGYSAASGGKILPLPKEKKERRLVFDSLPLWVYLTAVGALILIIWALISHLL
jgi:hypothetical protein